ncbi:permease [Listeria floridensis FSL S10-1187]|uniref:Permease n=1 Tax=Listeria floridensis FSL S10-1187 TaxID=1265817 RepID=A0ABP3B1E6_9LIST|nr:MFS transporter [Listeria floridensis]EUJ33740.1 permease [Listeria floridensis FSL S10-1187]
MNSLAQESKKQIFKVILSGITGNLGSGVLTFIIGLLILRETNSAFSFGISQVIGPVVALVLLPITGSIIDRFERKKIVVYAQLLSVFSLTVYVFVLYYQGFSHLIYTYLLLICLRISDQFLTTAFTASVVHIVVEDDIQKLKSFQQMISSLAAIFAPLLGAVLFDILPLTILVLLEIGIELLTVAIILNIDFRLTGVPDADYTNDEPQSVFKKCSVKGLFLLKRVANLFLLYFSPC